MDSSLAVKDATHYFPWYFFKISCCWKSIIMLSHLNLKSTIPVQTTAYARKLHLNSVTDRLMQFQITLKLWEAHTQEKRINSRFPLVSFPLQYTSHKNDYGKLPITVPLPHKPHPPATCQETGSEYREGGTTKVMPPAPAKRLSRGLSSMRRCSHALF